MTTSTPPPTGGSPNPDHTSTWSREAFPANPSPSPDTDAAQPTHDGRGPAWSPSSPRFAPSGCCGRTCPACAPEDSTPSTLTLFDWDTDTESDAFELVRWAPHTHVPGCSEWPTPRATDGERGGRGDLLAKLRTGTTSRRKDWRNGAPRRGHGTGDWASEPRLDRLVDGLPRELVEHQLRAYGNAAVPAVIAHIGHLITAAHHAMTGTEVAA